MSLKISGGMYAAICTFYSPTCESTWKGLNCPVVRKACIGKKVRWYINRTENFVVSDYICIFEKDIIRNLQTSFVACFYCWCALLHSDNFVLLKTTWLRTSSYRFFWSTICLALKDYLSEDSNTNQKDLHLHSIFMHQRPLKN